MFCSEAGQGEQRLDKIVLELSRAASGSKFTHKILFRGEGEIRNQGRQKCFVREAETKPEAEEF